MTRALVLTIGMLLICSHSTPHCLGTPSRSTEVPVGTRGGGPIAQTISPRKDVSTMPVTFDIWPEGYLDAEATSRGTEQPSEDDDIIRLGDVEVPTMTIYPADTSQTPGPAVLICPGGGYHILAMNLEGTEIAEWLNSLGITVALLRYRVPGNRDGAYADGQRAMSLLRSRADEFGIDPERIGGIGFSAGGNLLARVSTGFEERSYEAVDDADAVSSRPDFAMLVYPYLLQEDGQLSDEIQITAETPPAILVHAQDDWVDARSSIYYFLGLKEAGVPSELHVFPDGDHGYGLRPSEHAISGWPKLCERWLQGLGVIEP